MRKSLSLNLLTLTLILAVLAAGLGSAVPSPVRAQCGFDCGDVSEIPRAQCEALVALYEATDGDNWVDNTGWLVTNTPCAWHGIGCLGGNVTRLHLRHNQLSGPIPPQIGNLSGLEWLFVPHNQLSGHIPAEIGKISALGALILWNNQLSGPIPPEIGNLTALTLLHLGHNQLSGTIPPEIGNLTALTDLHLGGNQLSGPIPSQIGNLTALTDLMLGPNQLSGPIPSQISSLTALTTLGLGGNQLSGPIPPEIGNLTALTRLSLSRNQLSGELPVALTHLTELLEFYFNDTDLCVPPSGPVPEWLSAIDNVQGTGLICNGMDVDIGFRPYPHGYGFDNWGGAYPASPTPLDPDFGEEDLIRMFGAEAVCWGDASANCTVRAAARQWQENVNIAMNLGHCDGMAVTSLRFFEGLDAPSDLQIGAQYANDLWFTNARHHISYYWALVVPNPVAEARAQTLLFDSVEQVLSRVYLGLSEGAADPTTLLVYEEQDDGRLAGHAVTPYAIEDRANGEYWVWVYDNNDSNDSTRRVDINAADDTWSYDMRGSRGVWSGNGDTLGAIPISTYARRPECPWCDGTETLAASAPNKLQTSLSGHGRLLITDSHGRRIGHAGNQFVNEIPGAFGSVLPGGLGTAADPIYHLPISESYSMLLDGQTLTQTETAEVTQFGPGYAAWFESITVGPTTQDHLTIATDGKQLVYAPNEAREATMGSALDDATATRKLQIHGAEVGAGQVVTLTTDVDQGHLVFDNTQTGGGQYSIDIQQTSDTGEHRFIHADVSVSAGDTHYVGYGAWDGEGTVQLGIDYGSDGIINETVELDNQTATVYLPLVLRNR